MKLQEYEQVVPLKVQTCPYSPEPKKFGTEAQSSLPPDSSPKLDAKGIKRVQQIVGSILYYARAVDMTVLMALSAIAVEQTKATEKTMSRCIQLLDYLAGHSEAKVRFHASDMILNIHSDTSYLSEAKAHSRTCGHFFPGMDATRRQTDSSEWRFLRKQNNFAIRRCLRRQSRTRRPVP